MRKILYSILFVVMLTHTLLGQPRLGGGGPMRDIFQGQPPPPGAVSVLGRSFFGALENGSAGSFALLAGVDDQNVRQELGLTDTEVNSIRLLRGAMLMNAPQYAVKFRNMTEETQANVQADLSRDLGRITASLNTAMSAERQQNVQKLVFQTLGGVDSPIINLSAMEVLELSEDQKGKLKGVFDDMREERVAQMEKMLGMAEKVIAAGGPQNLSEEERDELRKAGQELESQSFETAKKLAERLRQHLTPAQLAKEKELLASRPAFLPPLPRQMREGRENNQGYTENNEGNGYNPGPDAWQPGQGLPGQVMEPRGSGRFPRGETE